MSGLSSEAITALGTVLLVLVGMAQAGIVVSQRRHARLGLSEAYWRRWRESADAWAALVFIGRDPGDYYQVTEGPTLDRFDALVEGTRAEMPSTWALTSVSTVGELLSDMCLQVLSGRLSVSDVYAILGTRFLRQGRPLRRLLDPDSVPPTDDDGQPTRPDGPHYDVQTELQDWLVYHDGIRRRALILIDLLWAEAARLEDLPPDELRRAALVKRQTGHLNRRRLLRETLRLRGPMGLLRSIYLSEFLGHGEYRGTFTWIGLTDRRLELLETMWVGRLLRDSACNGLTSGSS